jgi:hypothetical protein
MRGILILLSVSAIGLRAEPATFESRVAPILDRSCTVCHGAEKQKSGLRLDSHAALMKGGEGGAAVTPGSLKESDLYRRITLSSTEEDFMPSDGKPALTPLEVKVVELWITAGAPKTAEFDAPSPRVDAVATPAAPDYRSRLPQVAELERALGVKLVPRSRLATDGLVLRTASAPARCDDAALAKLAGVADLIVEAELARTKVTDSGLSVVATWRNLQRLDLARTAVTTAGVSTLASLEKLEALNLTATKVDEAALAALRTGSPVRKVWFFGSPASPAP